MSARVAFALGLVVGALAYPLGVVVGDVLGGRAACSPPADVRYGLCPSPSAGVTH